MKSPLSQAFFVPDVHPRLRRRISRYTLDCGFKTSESPALRGFVGGLRTLATAALYLVLKSNGLRHSKNLPVKFGFSSKTVPANIVQKLSAHSLLKSVFFRISTSLTNGPRSLSRVKAGTHSAFREGSHTRAHTAKQGPPERGRYHYPRSVPHVSETLRGQGLKRRTLPLWDLGREVLSKNAESLRDSDALMRVAVPRRRGPAGLRNLFLLLSELWLVHPALRTLCVYEVGVVSLPSACFACC